jgi:hypothetical protein
MVQKPRLAVLFILLEGDPKRVGDVYSFSIVLSEEDANDSFEGIAGDGTGVVVCY